MGTNAWWAGFCTGILTAVAGLSFACCCIAYSEASGREAEQWQKERAEWKVQFEEYKQMYAPKR